MFSSGNTLRGWQPWVASSCTLIRQEEGIGLEREHQQHSAQAVFTAKLNRGGNLQVPPHGCAAQHSLHIPRHADSD